MINPSDSTSVVKEQIEDAVSLAGYSAPTSWADATDKINGTADQFERDQIADGMNGGLARDRINALFGGPVWAPEGARLTIDFAANKAWTRNNPVTDSVDAVDLTRAGSVLMLGPDGYEEFAAGELARIDGIGAQVAPARVNKCTNYNANPVDLTGVSLTSSPAEATLTLVDDTAALVASGFGGLISSGLQNGKVYKLDNSLGAGTAQAQISGVVGDLNPHTITAYARGSGGRARTRLSTVTDGSAYTVLTDTYQRLRVTLTPTATTETARIQAEPGVTVYFILNQLEEGSYASPPIITSGAAVSRPGDILSDSVPDGGRAFVFEFDLLEPVVGVTGRRLLQWSNGTNAEYWSAAMAPSGAINLAYATGNVYIGGTTGGPITVLGRNVLYGVCDDGFMKVGRVSGTESQTATGLGKPSLTSTLTVGCRPDSTNNNSFIHAHRFTERPLTDFATPADAFAWAKSIAQGWA
jgi:hypothetical protein